MTVTISARQAAAVLHVTPEAIRQWAHRGHVRHYGRDRYDVQDLADHMRRRAEKIAAV